MNGRAAERQRRWRRRRACGIAVVKVVIPTYETAEALIAAGRISVADALDRRAVGRALSEVIVDWSQHWRE